MYIVLCNVHVHNFIQFVSRDSINQSGNKIKNAFSTSLPTATTTTPTTTKNINPIGWDTLFGMYIMLHNNALWAHSIMGPWAHMQKSKSMEYG